MREAIEKYFTMPVHEQWQAKTFPEQESRQESSTSVINEVRAIAVAHLNETVLIGSLGGVMRLFFIVVGEMNMEDFYKLRFENMGYIKLRSDGVDSFVDKIVGLVKW